MQDDADDDGDDDDDDDENDENEERRVDRRRRCSLKMTWIVLVSVLVSVLRLLVNSQLVCYSHLA